MHEDSDMMEANNKCQSDIDKQRVINRAMLLTVSSLEEKGLCFGRNRIGSILKGHKHKYVLDNKLDSIDTYGLLKETDFKDIVVNIDKLIQHGYLIEKRPDFNNLKFSDDMGNAVYMTDKGREKLSTFSNVDLIIC